MVNEVRMAGKVAGGPRDVDELEIPPGTAGEMARLRAAGFVLLVVSNQPDVARGTLEADAVERINRHLVEALGIDGVYWCPHDNADRCRCRKPRPGLVLDGVRDWGVDPSRSWLIGDRWVDLVAARAAGIAGILLERPYSWHPTSQGGPPRDAVPCHTSGTLSGCIDFILGEFPEISRRSSGRRREPRRRNR